MHPTTTPPPSEPPSPAETLDKIIQLLGQLLPSTLSIISFTSRWQILRTKLASLKSLLSEISYFPHWSDNPLLHSLLPKSSFHYLSYTDPLSSMLRSFVQSRQAPYAIRPRHGCWLVVQANSGPRPSTTFRGSPSIHCYCSFSPYCKRLKGRPVFFCQGSFHQAPDRRP
ncbi:Arm 2 domain-containing protein [Abeliophyllum distichum]|uniref:Arm 2 domain-containing protein n=1 Tax=Abeliophyllum distichum TaxID=126358 RepID=A0ABD1UIA2_9LAMI